MMRVSILALLVAACSLQIEANSVNVNGLQVEVDNYKIRAKAAPINEITVRDHSKREFHPVDLTTKVSAGTKHLKPAHYSPPRDDPKAAAPQMSEHPFLTPPGDNPIDSINITVIPVKHPHSRNGSSGDSPAQSAIINNNNRDAANINHRLSQTGKEAQHVAQTIDDELSSEGKFSSIDEFPAPGFYRLSGIKRSESEDLHDIILRPNGADNAYHGRSPWRSDFPMGKLIEKRQMDEGMMPMPKHKSQDTHPSDTPLQRSTDDPEQHPGTLYGYFFKREEGWPMEALQKRAPKTHAIMVTATAGMSGMSSSFASTYLYHSKAMETAKIPKTESHPMATVDVANTASESSRYAQVATAFSLVLGLASVILAL